jgi:hypothetical protein
MIVKRVTVFGTLACSLRVGDPSYLSNRPHINQDCPTRPDGSLAGLRARRTIALGVSDAMFDDARWGDDPRDRGDSERGFSRGASDNRDRNN